MSDARDPSKVWCSLAIAISGVLALGNVSMVKEPGSSATPTHSAVGVKVAQIREVLHDRFSFQSSHFIYPSEEGEIL